MDLVYGEKYKYISKIDVNCTECKEPEDNDKIIQCNPAPILLASLEEALQNMLNITSYTMQSYSSNNNQHVTNHGC